VSEHAIDRRDGERESGGEHGEHGERGEERYVRVVVHGRWAWLGSESGVDLKRSTERTARWIQREVSTAGRRRRAERAEEQWGDGDSDSDGDSDGEREREGRNGSDLEKKRKE
jgi:hypothetical protein